MHQTWGKLLFIHWPIDTAVLRPLIPRQLEIDTFDGSAWIGVIPFTMWGIRAAFMPPIPGTSAFHELNVRTYVHLNGVPGVWFFSLDAASRLAVWGARRFYYLPYFYAQMSLDQSGNEIIYSSQRRDKHGPPAGLQATWVIGDPLPSPSSGSIDRNVCPTSLDFFLTERYCLYSENKGEVYRARIHHQPWPLHNATLSSLNSTMVESLGVTAPSGNPHLRYAEEISVEIWPLRNTWDNMKTQTNR